MPRSIFSRGASLIKGKIMEKVRKIRKADSEANTIMAKIFGAIGTLNFLLAALDINAKGAANKLDYTLLAIAIVLCGSALVIWAKNVTEIKDKNELR